MNLVELLPLSCFLTKVLNIALCHYFSMGALRSYFIAAALGTATLLSSPRSYADGPSPESPSLDNFSIAGTTTVNS